MSEKGTKGNWVRRTRVVYFLTTVLVFIGLFTAAFFVMFMLLRMLQVHPYFYLLTAIILLIADIPATNEIVNCRLASKWICHN